MKYNKEKKGGARKKNMKRMNKERPEIRSVKRLLYSFTSLTYKPCFSFFLSF